EGPRGEGARKSKIHPGAIPGNLVRNDFWQSGRSWRGSRVACFWATSLEKIFGGTTTPTRSKGRLIRCTVPRSTPNRLARLAPRASQASPGPHGFAFRGWE